MSYIFFSHYNIIWWNMYSTHSSQWYYLHPLSIWESTDVEPTVLCGLVSSSSNLWFKINTLTVVNRFIPPSVISVLINVVISVHKNVQRNHPVSSLNELDVTLLATGRRYKHTSVSCLLWQFGPCQSFFISPAHVHYMNRLSASHCFKHRTFRTSLPLQIPDLSARCKKWTHTHTHTHLVLSLFQVSTGPERQAQAMAYLSFIFSPT